MGSDNKRRMAIAFAAIGAFLHLYAPQSVLPRIAQEFGVRAVDASLVIIAGTLAVAATAPFTGALSDVFGRKRVIVTALGLLIIPATMTALSPTLNQIIFWRFVHGLLLPPIFTVTVAYIGDEFPTNEANAAFGVYAAASAIGGFLSRLIPGVLTAYVGWRGGFLALACGSVVCFVGVLTLLPHEKRFVRAPNVRTSLQQMLGHLRNPTLLAIYAVGFGILFNFIATFTYLSFHLASPPFNRSPAFLGSIFIVYLFGSVASLWLGRAIAMRGRRFFVLCMLVIWATGMLFSLLPSVPAIVFSMAVASICGLLVQASTTSYAATTPKIGTSAAVGLYVTSYYVGGTFGGWLPGLAYEAGGWPWSLALVLSMLCIMICIVAKFWR
jgi:predicted MFS family arabinose efflux permease